MPLNTLTGFLLITLNFFHLFFLVKITKTCITIVANCSIEITPNILILGISQAYIWNWKIKQNILCINWRQLCYYQKKNYYEKYQKFSSNILSKNFLLSICGSVNYIVDLSTVNHYKLGHLNQNLDICYFWSFLIDFFLQLKTIGPFCFWNGYGCEKKTNFLYKQKTLMHCFFLINLYESSKYKRLIWMACGNFYSFQRRILVIWKSSRIGNYANQIGEKNFNCVFFFFSFVTLFNFSSPFFVQSPKLAVWSQYSKIINFTSRTVSIRKSYVENTLTLCVCVFESVWAFVLDILFQHEIQIELFLHRESYFNISTCSFFTYLHKLKYC